MTACMSCSPNCWVPSCGLMIGDCSTPWAKALLGCARLAITDHKKGAMTSSEPNHQLPYFQVARFDSEKPAGRAYNQLQDAIFHSPACELSAFRLMLDRQWHV